MILEIFGSTVANEVKYLLSEKENLVYSSAETKEEIIQVISERGNADPGSKHVIISPNLNFFTFELPNSHSVDIVTRLDTQTVADKLDSLEMEGPLAINLAQVHADKLVPAVNLQPVPQNSRTEGLESDPELTVREFTSNYKLNRILRQGLTDSIPFPVRFSFLLGTSGMHGCNVKEVINSQALSQFYFSNGEIPEDIDLERGDFIDGNFTSSRNLIQFKKTVHGMSLSDVVEWQFDNFNIMSAPSPIETQIIRDFINAMVSDKRYCKTHLLSRNKPVFPWLHPLLMLLETWEVATQTLIEPRCPTWRPSMIQVGRLLTDHEAKQAKMGYIYGDDGNAADLVIYRNEDVLIGPIKEDDAL